MPDLVIYLGRAALVLAAFLVVLALFICVVTLVIHAFRKLRQMYEL
jgi:cbb3-type cytochrome oxidase subunit 3